MIYFVYNLQITLKGILLMKSTSFLFSLSLLIILTACGQKSSPEEEVSTDINMSIRDTLEKNASLSNREEQEEIIQAPQTFILTDVDERDLNMTLDGEQMTFQGIDQSLVLLNFFATWCPPCKGEVPELSHLQKKNAKDLFVVGVLVNDDLNSTELRHFMEKYDANYFISYSEANSDLAAQIIKSLKLPENFPIPLSLLYKDGRLFRYYEGAMPIEMIENELKQALKQP